jgi:hypothetical protein
MTRVLFGVATVAMLAIGSGTASAQAPVVPTYPQLPTPTYAQPAVGGTIVTTPVIPVTGVITPPPVVITPVLPVIRIGYPYYGYPYYGRSFYYPPYYRHRW